MSKEHYAARAQISAQEFLRKENATVALMAILQKLKVLKPDKFMDRLISLNQIHKFIARQVK